VASILGPPKVSVRRLWQARGIQPTTKGDSLETVPGPDSISTTPPSELNLKAFEERFPGIIQDGVLDADRLGAILGINISASKDAKERFGLMWAGKQDAIQALMTPSLATLKPDLENSINWDTAENVFIEGDNLEVLKLLQNAYNDQVKLIYIDPPYNTGNDFVYKDDFSDPIKHYLEVTGQVDAEGNKLVANTETSGRKHSNWLTMMYPRLVLARNLLAQDGAIFISIDNNEVAHLKLLCNEIFGENNFIGILIWRKKEGGGQTDQYFVTEHEYILAYARSSEYKWQDEVIPDEGFSFNKSDENGQFKAVKLAKWGNTSRRTDRPTMYFPIQAPNGTKVYPIAPDGEDGRWRVSSKRMEALIKNELIFWKEQENTWIPYEKVYFTEGDVKVIKERSILYDLATTADGTKELTHIFGKKDVFQNPKPVKLIEFLLERGAPKDAIVLDFFAGSGTTAHATLRANSSDGGNRKFILVNIDESTDQDSLAFQEGYEKVSDVTLARILGAMAEVTDSKNEGLKALSLSKSNFHILSQSQTDTPKLFESTLDEDLVVENVVQEVLLKLGERLDTKQERITLGECTAVRCGATLIVPSLEIDEKIVQEAVTVATGVVVFLEDAFAGKDALKANTYFSARSKNIIMKTF
jgi:adenine-specific DNA-methyltransferase